MSRTLSVIAVMLLGLQGTKPSPVSPDPNTPRPIDAVDSVFIEDLTWMEVRDAMKAGKDTVIIATGGIEQNGPYLVAGKHNVVLRATTDAIARKLGNALVAPIIGFVPEGDINPPTEHMKYPSTVMYESAGFGCAPFPSSYALAAAPCGVIPSPPVMARICRASVEAIFSLINRAASVWASGPPCAIFKVRRPITEDASTPKDQVSIVSFIQGLARMGLSPSSGRRAAPCGLRSPTAP